MRQAPCELTHIKSHPKEAEKESLTHIKSNRNRGGYLYEHESRATAGLFKGHPKTL